jgi:hypothetical protein
MTLARTLVSQHAADLPALVAALRVQVERLDFFGGVYTNGDTTLYPLPDGSIVGVEATGAAVLRHATLPGGTWLVDDDARWALLDDDGQPVGFTWEFA